MPRKSKLPTRWDCTPKTCSTRERIFDPFVTHGKTHGTGLGLAVVTRIVEEHHGDVSVSSSTTGTTFTIRLPLTIYQYSSNQPEAKVASL